MRIFTIGFTKKSAEEFFTLLENSGVKRLIDVRLNNSSQLAGFSKGRDLSYLLNKILGIDYIHIVELAPTREILDAYKKKQITWFEYEKEFLTLLEQRKPQLVEEIDNLDQICLLCSEEFSHQCHRRLVAEYIQKVNPEVNIEIVHL